MSNAKIAGLLKALGNPVRFEVAARLFNLNEMTVNEIVAALEMSQSAVSQHLAKMRSGGAVNTRRQAQKIFYSLTDDARTVMNALR